MAKIPLNKVISQDSYSPIPNKADCMPSGMGYCNHWPLLPDRNRCFTSHYPMQISMHEAVWNNLRKTDFISSFNILFLLLLHFNQLLFRMSNLFEYTRINKNWS